MSTSKTDPIRDFRTRPTLTIGEVADLLTVSKSTAYRWAREGVLPVIHLGSKSVRVRTVDLLALLDEH